MRLSADLAQARNVAPGMNEMMDLYGIGDHGGGPTRAILDEGDHWATGDKVVPKMQFGTAQTYFSSVEKELAPSSPEWDYRSIAAGYHAPPARRRRRSPSPPGKTKCTSSTTAAS